MMTFVLLLLPAFVLCAVHELENLEQVTTPTLVSFVASWCPHCQRLKSVLPTLVDKLADLSVNVATIDCVAHASVCANASVSGYPTIKFFFGESNTTPKKYTRRERDAAALEQFVRRLIGPSVQLVRNADELAQFRALSPRVAVLGVARTETHSVRDLLEKLASRLNADDDDVIRVGLMIDPTHEADTAHVTLLRSFDEPRLFFDGDDDADALHTWVLAHRKPLLDKHKLGVYSSKEPLVFLHRDVRPGAADDSAVVDAVREASRQLRAEPVSFAWLDKDQWDGVRAGLSGKRYPALTIDDIRFVNRRYAYDESRPIETSAVVTWVRSLLAGQLAHTNFSQPLALAADNANAAVKVLVLDNFDELVTRRTTNLFVLFHSPTCGTCQQVYAPFEQLAREFEGKLSFLKGEAWMNDFPEWLKLSGVPDLRFFGATSGQRTREFEGNDRSVAKMRAWLNEQLLAQPAKQPHDEL